MNPGSGVSVAAVAASRRTVATSSTVQAWARAPCSRCRVRRDLEAGRFWLLLRSLLVLLRLPHIPARQGSASSRTTSCRASPQHSGMRMLSTSSPRPRFAAAGPRRSFRPDGRTPATSRPVHERRQWRCLIATSTCRCGGCGGTRVPHRSVACGVRALGAEVAASCPCVHTYACGGSSLGHMGFRDQTWLCACALMDVAAGLPQ